MTLGWDTAGLEWNGQPLAWEDQMPTVPIVPKKLPAVTNTFVNGSPPGHLQRDPGDSLGTLLELPSYGMQALHLAAAEAGMHLETTGRGRSLAAQTSLFLSRMTPNYDPAVNVSVDSRVVKLDQRGIHPDLIPGRRWYKRRGVAACASPGTSNHGYWCADDVSEEYDGDPATDPIRGSTVEWLVPRAHLYGWTWELQSEPWHLTWCAGDELPPACQSILRRYGIPFPGDTIPGGNTVYERAVPNKGKKRVYDSREEGGLFQRGQHRDINITREDGTVPPGTVGVRVVIGATQILGNGFIAAWKPGDEWGGDIVQSITPILPSIAGSDEVEVAFDAIRVMVDGDERCAAHITVDVKAYLLG